MRVKSKSSKANKFRCFLITRCLRVRLSWLIFDSFATFFHMRFLFYIDRVSQLKEFEIIIL